MMNELALVTGGAGFIGSHLVEALLASGQSVRVLDDLSTGLRENLAISPSAAFARLDDEARNERSRRSQGERGARADPSAAFARLDDEARNERKSRSQGERGARADSNAQSVELIEGDVGNPTVVTQAMNGVGVVYHLAALASVQRSVETPADTHHVCTSGTLHVLDAARRAGVRRVVYAASSSAYGIPPGEEQREVDMPHPLSPYAAAKLAGEFYAQAFTATYGLETVSLRFFNIFGPRQRADSPYSGVIALFVAALTEGRRPKVFGDGEQSRDFTYVTDVVQALRKAATVEGASGNVYNVGTGRRITILDLIHTLNRLLGTNVTPEHAPPRAGDVRHSRADITRTRQDLGYEPRVSFEEGLAETLRWYQSLSK